MYSEAVLEQSIGGRGYSKFMREWQADKEVVQRRVS
jgi:hypothetical protein